MTVLRCAIYTRKSSEEGLDQSFNSIDAQREACEAYAVSQRHEGWKVLPARYDDGGYSGGSMERPALKQLLEDIRTGLVDLVVVYKIDRLTRSLSDFAKMVEVFDASGASFVSITQHFNTTTSMGRLMLNVLLSFAQFEREVTGERIRDKIAASKKKGMWMGGTVPLGYDTVERRLVVNSVEADHIREIYRQYLALGDVRQLQGYLKRQGIVSKRRVSRHGVLSGGLNFFRGALYTILKNRIYLGEISHRGQSYPGQHEAIVSPEDWSAVQIQLKQNSHDRRRGVKATESSLLAGWVFDGSGRRLIPSHAKKQGKRYRYYVVRDAVEGDGYKPVKISVPANDLESTVTGALTYWLEDVPRLIGDLRLARRVASVRDGVLEKARQLAQQMRALDPKGLRALLEPLVQWIEVGHEDVQIRLKRPGLLEVLGLKMESMDEPSTEDMVVIPVQASLQRTGLEMRLVVAESWADAEKPNLDWPLIKAVAKSHGWMQKLTSGEFKSTREICEAEKVSDVYARRVLRCAVLAPDIVEAILEGRQPDSLSFTSIAFAQPPLLWEEQRKKYGFTDGDANCASGGRRSTATSGEDLHELPSLR